MLIQLLPRSTACPTKDFVNEFNVCFVVLHKDEDRVQIEGVGTSHMLLTSTMPFTEDKLSQTTGDLPLPAFGEGTEGKRGC